MSDVATELEELADRYAPHIEIPSPATVDQARRNLSLRVSLLKEFGAIRPEELSDLVQSGAKRRTATVENWRRSHRVVTVRWRGETLVPGFQLLPNAQPDPHLRPVLSLLKEQGFSDWQAALWWIIPAPALAGRRPVDLLMDLRQRENADLTPLVGAAARKRDWF